MSRSAKVATSAAKSTAKPPLGAPNGGSLTRRVAAAIRILGNEFTITEVATYVGIPRSAVAIRIQNMVARKQLETVSLHNHEAVYSIRYLKPASNPEETLAILMGNLRYEDHIPKPRRQYLQGQQATHDSGGSRMQPITT